MIQFFGKPTVDEAAFCVKISKFKEISSNFGVDFDTLADISGFNSVPYISSDGLAGFCMRMYYA